MWYDFRMDIQAIQPKIAALARKHKLRLVVLFGSQATGKIHPKSDIDVGYVASPDLNFEASLDAANDLRELLGREDVEFVNMRKISPLLRKIISDEGILLYEDTPGTFVQFKMYAFKKYIETKPLRELRYKSLRKFAYGNTQ